jgi:hypothetical protein
VDPVALAATIGGSAVGIAGVAATAWSNWLQRDSAKELAALQHEHERELARGARLFERRAPVYEEMLTLLNVWMDRVDATERLWTSPTDPEPPELPDPEKWRAMQAQLATGSIVVSDAYREFSVSIRDFYDRVMELRTIMDGRMEGDAGDAATKMDDARRNVRETLRKLERLVSDELAAL